MASPKSSGGVWAGAAVVVVALLVMFHLQGRAMPRQLTADQRNICAAMLATADADRAPAYCGD